MVSVILLFVIVCCVCIGDVLVIEVMIELLV